MQCLPHPFRSPLIRKPEAQVILVKRCCSDDLSAVLFIPLKLIRNCPEATAYCIWNKTASLFSSTSSPGEDEFTTSEKRISIPRFTALLFLSFANDSHPGVATSFSLHELHPCTVERAPWTSLSTAECRSSRLWIMLHCISGNLIAKWCSISSGAALPVRKRKKSNVRTKYFKELSA